MCYGPEFIAINVRGWLGRIGVNTLYIEPASPWESVYCGSFNSKLRDELLSAVAQTLQCGQAALLAKLSTAGARWDLAASIRSALRSASASPEAG